jgi:ribosomal protein S18 acetylase RimI-like enzyme
MPWGIREYTIRDPNGYHLRFSGPTTYEPRENASDTLPPSIEIADRLPTWEEYLALSQSVGGNTKGYPPDVLERSLIGCVAIDTETGQIVGMARAMRDAHAWYSVWDVNVRPEYQSRRIGTALMERVLARLRELGPAGSFVFLFTMKPAFYERMGFKTDTVTIMRL